MAPKPETNVANNSIMASVLVRHCNYSTCVLVHQNKHQRTGTSWYAIVIISVLIPYLFKRGSAAIEHLYTFL